MHMGCPCFFASRDFIFLSTTVCSYVWLVTGTTLDGAVRFLAGGKKSSLNGMVFERVQCEIQKQNAVKKKNVQSIAAYETGGRPGATTKVRRPRTALLPFLCCDDN